MARALKINPLDNVAVLLGDAEAGEMVEVIGDRPVIRLKARRRIAFGHKIALINLEADQPIIKYGEEIGRAQSAIAAGDWIHLHNIACDRGHENQES